MSTARERPTEVTSAVAGALAFLIVTALGVDDTAVTAALVVVLGALPAVVTWCVVTWRSVDGRDRGPV